MDFSQCTIRPTTPEDMHLPTFDYTKMTAINTCPRWGLIRYDQHKRMPGEGRSTALEMGAAAHDVFAAIRFFQLYEYGREVYRESYDEAVVRSHCESVLGKNRSDTIYTLAHSDEDQRRRVNAVAIYTANNAGYYDDPNDKRRTLSNLENSLIAYIDRLPLNERIPFVDWERKFVGIEVPVDVVVTFGDVSFRYTGKIDGVTLSNGNTVEIDENKTASRLDQAWQDGMMMSHQVTGYMLACEALTSRVCNEGMIRGLMIPLPRTYDLGGIVNMPVDRDQWRRLEWFRWVWNTLEVYFKHKDDPLNAPEFTHSCNRYFRSCSFIPLCAMADPDERAITYEQMVIDEWSPLAETGGD